MPLRGQASFTYMDYDGEKSSTRFLRTVPDNVLGVRNIQTWLEDMDALKTAFDNVTVGVFTQWTYSLTESGIAVPPTLKRAQRETKWLVTCVDTTESFEGSSNPRYGKLFNFEIPTADTDLLGEGGLGQRKEVDITVGVGLALKQAIEAHVRAPSGGAPEVISVTHASRNT